jgi:phosphoglycerate dehydrogenase-like enzyme
LGRGGSHCGDSDPLADASADLSAEAERKLALLADVVSSFINTARGAVIDEDALLSDLNTGRIVAALHVFDEELQPSKSPFRSLSNVVL